MDIKSNRKRRLLIVTSNFYPSKTIGTQRILRIVKYLDKSIWSIYVLTLKSKYLSESKGNADPDLKRLLKKLTVYRTRKLEIMKYFAKAKSFAFGEKYSNEKKCDNKNFKKRNKIGSISSLKSFLKDIIMKVGGIIGDILQFPDREIIWLPFAVLNGYFIIKRHKIDTIFSSSPYHSNHLVTTILKILTKKKLVIDFRDPWASSSWREEERTSTALKRFQYKLIKYFEKWVVQKANKVISINREIRNDFINNYNQIPSNKFETFYNGYDPSNIQESCQIKIKRKDKNHGKLKFIHVGTLYKRRDPTPLILAIKSLKEKKMLNPDRVSIQFVGRMSETIKPVKNLVTKLKIENIIEFKPEVNYKKSFDYMRFSDVLILLQPATKLQIPGKFYDYICFEKPILAIGEKKSAVENLIKNKFGLFASFHDINEIEKCIIALIKTPKMFRDRISNMREKFDISKSMKEFEKILLR